MRILKVVIPLVVTLTGAESTFAADRAPLTVSASAESCTQATGAFVALLDPDRGLLLLSSAEFPGARRVGEAAGGPESWRGSSGRTWSLERAATAGVSAGLWAAEHPWRKASARGCVAFAKSRFSSEGDLVTYLRWLAEDVFAALPPAELERRRVLELRGREVVLRISQSGYRALELRGTEGSTLAFKGPGAEETTLLLPFVLDQASGRLAIQVSTTRGDYFSDADKVSQGWLVTTYDEPARLAEPAATVTTASVGE